MKRRDIIDRQENARDMNGGRWTERDPEDAESHGTYYLVLVLVLTVNSDLAVFASSCCVSLW